MNYIFKGPDIRKEQLPLDDASVQCIVTSPPYLCRRRYSDEDDEWGTGSLENYEKDTRAALAEYWRVLDDTGLMFWVIGDSAANTGGAGGDYTRKDGNYTGRRPYKGLKLNVPSPAWALVPQRTALWAQEDGWRVRSFITWVKHTRKPESLAHARRPGEQTEYVIMLAKSKAHRFRDVCDEKGDVWHIMNKAEPDMPKGEAPFPVELARRSIAMTLGPGEGIVLDACAGRGTVGVAADLCGVESIMFDPFSYTEAHYTLFPKSLKAKTAVEADVTPGEGLPVEVRAVES